MGAIQDARLDGDKLSLPPKELTVEQKELENASSEEGKTIGEVIYTYLMDKILSEGQRI